MPSAARSRALPTLTAAASSPPSRTARIARLATARAGRSGGRRRRSRSCWVAASFPDDVRRSTRSSPCRSPRASCAPRTPVLGRPGRGRRRSRTQRRGAWRGLVAGPARGRAAWLIERYDPRSRATRPTKPTEPTSCSCRRRTPLPAAGAPRRRAPTGAPLAARSSRRPRAAPALVAAVGGRGAAELRSRGPSRATSTTATGRRRRATVGVPCEPARLRPPIGATRPRCVDAAAPRSMSLPERLRAARLPRRAAGRSSDAGARRSRAADRRPDPRRRRRTSSSARTTATWSSPRRAALDGRLRRGGRRSAWASGSTLRAVRQRAGFDRLLVLGVAAQRRRRRRPRRTLEDAARAPPLRPRRVRAGAAGHADQQHRGRRRRLRPRRRRRRQLRRLVRPRPPDCAGRPAAHRDATGSGSPSCSASTRRVSTACRTPAARDQARGAGDEHRAVAGDAGATRWRR